MSFIDIDNYESSFNDLVKFCTSIKNQKDDTNKKLMKNYVIIRLVSLIEFNLKALITYLIDELDIKPHTILDEDSIEIDLDVLQRFKSDQYTKGSVIIAHLDKMNPGITYRILSRINKLDFFRWYENLLGNKEEGQAYSNLKDLYKIRNDVVHNLYDVEFSPKELLDKIKAYKQFGNSVNVENVKTIVKATFDHYNVSAIS